MSCMLLYSSEVFFFWFIICAIFLTALVSRLVRRPEMGGLIVDWIPSRTGNTERRYHDKGRGLFGGSLFFHSIVFRGQKSYQKYEISTSYDAPHRTASSSTRGFARTMHSLPVTMTVGETGTISP